MHAELAENVRVWSPVSSLGAALSADGDAHPNHAWCWLCSEGSGTPTPLLTTPTSPSDLWLELSANDKRQKCRPSSYTEEDLEKPFAPLCVPSARECCFSLGDSAKPGCWMHLILALSLTSRKPDSDPHSSFPPPGKESLLGWAGMLLSHRCYLV